MINKNYLNIILLITIIIFSGCNLTQSNMNESIYQGKKNFGRFELPQSDNECINDSNCYVGGCNGETCTANMAIGTYCDVPEGWQGGNCQCNQGKCIWVKK